MAAVCSARGVAVCCWRRTGGPRRVTATDLRLPGPVREEGNAELTVSVSDSVQQSGHCPSPLEHAAVGTLSFAFGTCSGRESVLRLWNSLLALCETTRPGPLSPYSHATVPLCTSPRGSHFTVQFGTNG